MDRPFPAYKGDEPYIFVSYSHKDSDVVFPEIARLKDQGINIWYDEGIEAGTEWTEALAVAIKRAKLFLYFVTPDSAQSLNCRNEVNFAVERQLPIVAVHLRKTELPDGLSLTLSSLQAILKYEVPSAEYQQKLVDRISNYLDQEVIKPPVSEKKKIGSVLLAVTGVLTLIIGLFFYTKQPATEVTNDTSAEASQTEPAIAAEVVAPDRFSVAVLPFTNMSNSEEAGFLAMGLSEDILNNLSQYKHLSVASSAAAVQFIERGEDAATVGKSLNVAYFLEGSIRQQGDKIRITVQLIRADDGYQVWSRSYERKLANSFEMQTAVALHISTRAMTKLSFDSFRKDGWEQSPVFDGIVPIAVLHYLDAQAEAGNIEWGEPGNWDTVEHLTEKAIAADPNFYTAYWYLSNQFRVRHQEGLPLALARPAATDAINKAFALAPQDVNVREQLAQNLVRFDLDYYRADKLFKGILAEYPNSWAVRLFLAKIDLREGRRSEARRRLKELSENQLGVQAAVLLSGVSAYQNFSADFDGALKTSERGLKVALSGIHRAPMLSIHAINLVALDRIEEARPFVEESWQLDGSINPENYVYLLAKIGEEDRAQGILDDPGFELKNHFFLALGNLALGDIDGTFESILASIENQDLLMIDSLVLSPMWDPIREDPRFYDMLELLDSKVTHTEQYLHDQVVLQDK